MSPLAASGGRGYGDYQRVSNFDTGILWAITQVASSAEADSPVMDVSRHAYIGGFLLCSAGSVRVNVNWWADKTQTLPVGSRTFFMGSNMGNPAQLRLPNLGPFCQFSVVSGDGNAFTFISRVLATNRVHPLEMIPTQPVLINLTAVAIAAGGTVTCDPTDYYSGPVLVSLVMTVAGVYSVQYQVAAGGFNICSEADIPANSHNLYTVIIPPSGWRIVVNNTGAGAGTLWLRVTPTTTGAT